MSLRNVHPMMSCILLVMNGVSYERRHVPTEALVEKAYFYVTEKRYLAYCSLQSYVHSLATLCSKMYNPTL